jgi:hypothetical protein
MQLMENPNIYYKIFSIVFPSPKQVKQTESSRALVQTKEKPKQQEMD